ncbi:MAG: hypothetical protein IT377_27945 [Polyangiaceae bacterium]|nr:hypothetical protein [Polyangiaceae bacterium]
MSSPTAKSVVIVTLILAVAIWLHLPSLGAGLAADDFLNRAMLEGRYPVPRSPLDLYAFLHRPGELAPMMDGGVVPWWSHPDLKLSLLRPLSSALLWFDQRVLDLSPRGQHVHSLLWAGALIGSYFLLARRLVTEGAALIATAILAFDSSLVAPIAWICNRTALVSATFGALGSWAYLRFRQDRWRPGAWLSPLSFALALAGGEYAICALGYVLAYELAGHGEPLRARLRGLALAVVPAAIYLGAHVAMGYGAKGSVVYIGPFDAPLHFALEALLRVPSMIATEFVLEPGEEVYAKLLARSPRAFLSLIPAAVVLLLAVGTWRRSDADGRRRLATAGLGMLMAMLPLVGTVPSVRLLLIASFGGSALLGAVIWDTGARLAEQRDLRAWLRVLPTAALAVWHLGHAPRLTRDYTYYWQKIVGGVRAKHLAAEIDDSKVADQELVLVNATGDLAALLYPPWVRNHHGAPMPKRWRVLGIARSPQRAIRVADDTLELVVLSGHMFEDPTSQLFRAPSRPFRAGDRVTLPGLEITVLEVDGWAPRRVRYRFDSSLDDPNRVFLLMEFGRMRRGFMPKVGEEFVVMPAG